MQRKHWLGTLAVILLFSAGGYAACTVQTGPDTEGVVSGVQLEPVHPGTDGVLPGGDMHVAVDAGRAGTDVEPSDEAMPVDSTPPNPGEAAPLDRCHDVICDATDVCCPSTGTCYPAECTDCCDAATDGLPGVAPAAVGTHPGPNGAPAFGGPEPPREMPSTLPDPDVPRPNE